MAKKFKDYYDLEAAKLIAGKISSTWKKFPEKEFVEYLKKELPNKEFLERQDAFVRAFEKTLKPLYADNIAIFHKILGSELETTTGMFTYGWWLWPIGRYVEKKGLENSDVSIEFIYELTKRFTGEFAMRPILEKYPQKTMKTVEKWSRDKNVHVRRLASECVRIRLPWAKKLTVALEHFSMYKKVLSNLRFDTEKFVQKSVGNNLNDLMKENSELAKEIISEWESSNPTKATFWIIKHGLRSTRK